MTLPFAHRTSCQISEIIWVSFYQEVARILHDIIMIIRYIFGQLFFHAMRSYLKGSR